MKKLMAIAAMALGLLLAQEVKANVMYLYGTVTSVTATGANTLIKVGDAVYIKINYAAANGAVTRVTVTVNDSPLNFSRTNDSSTVYVDEDPSNGTVQWTIFNSSVVNFDVASNTPGGTIPCIDSFDLGRTFAIIGVNGVNAQGTITAKPITRTGQ